MFDIKENLKKLPDTPGVYMHKDGLGRVIYVGKAVSLRNRVRQYFQVYGKSTPKLRALTSQIAEFEYITCGSEMEALILECNLIKKYQPKYNVLLRDDKTYPYIQVSLSDDYPRVVKTRELKNDSNKYFGPFSDVGSVNMVLDLLNKAYKLKRCKATSFPKGFRPCLNYHIDECDAPCIGNISKEEYRERIEIILAFLSGRNSDLIKDLKQKMGDASSNMEFEKAAKYRDLIAAAESLGDSQRVSMVSGKDMDVVIPIIGLKNSFISLFHVRGGKLIGRETMNIDGYEGDSEKDLVSEFIKQYYSKWADVPHDILVSVLPHEVELLESFLGREKHKVRIHVPKKGENRALLEMAKKDSAELKKTIEASETLKDERREAIRQELAGLMDEGGYSFDNAKDYRVEAYDISNTNGVDSVGAMVVFKGPDKVKKDYRRFKIKTIAGPDDYGSLKEMLIRRFKRAEKGDPAFKELPDIIFMDGGFGQVSSAIQAMAECNVNIPVVGLAKDDKHRTRAAVFPDGHELDLKERPLLYKYAGTIQEEVHRFAIDYHRNLRGKSSIKSLLDEIPGVGSVRRNALLSKFGSIDKIKEASVAELLEVEGMDKRTAENVSRFFRGSK